MREQLNHRGTLLSLFLLLVVAIGLSIASIFRFVSTPSFFEQAALIFALLIVWFVVYINLRPQTIDFDREQLFWKPLLRKKVYRIPFTRIKSVRTLGPPLTREGVRRLLRYRILVEGEQNDFSIYFSILQTRRNAEKLRQFCEWINRAKATCPTSDT